MTTSMIERVAMAICLAQTQTEDMWQAFLPEARAAIEAMKELTPSMLQAGIWADSEDGASDNPQEIWKSMIDKALES